MDLKNYTVVATGKIRPCAYEKLKNMVNLLDWQQGGRMPKEELEARLAQADFVMLAVNLNPSTKHLLNAVAFAQMKPGACLINISRGAVVDTEAMYEALKSGRLAYAAMDVTDPEPLPGEHKLLTLPNVTVTPHMASATAETRDAMAMLTVENIVAALEGRAMPAEVKTK